MDNYLSNIRGGYSENIVEPSLTETKTINKRGNKYEKTCILCNIQNF